MNCKTKKIIKNLIIFLFFWLPNLTLIKIVKVIDDNIDTREVSNYYTVNQLSLSLQIISTSSSIHLFGCTKFTKF